jgi:hypothetical protein
MRDIGFWDYTSQGGFTCRPLGTRWLTTGYRPRLPRLDQDLVEPWRMSLEDARRFQPAIPWFMGCGAGVDGVDPEPLFPLEEQAENSAVILDGSLCSWSSIQ